MKTKQGNQLGTRLKRYRMDHSLTQEQLGNLLGISQETIASYEHGTRFPRSATLRTLAKLTNISLDALLSSESSEIPAEILPDEGSFSPSRLVESLRSENIEFNFNLTSAWKERSNLNLGGVFEEILLPALKMIGSLWETGALSVADEHYLSAKIRSLGILHADAERRRHPVAIIPARRWLGLCAPGEEHDIALFFHSLALGQRGWNARFLGCNVPSDDLILAIEDFKPIVLAFSVTMEKNLAALDLRAGLVKSRFGSTISVIAGGRCLKPDTEKLVATLDARFTSLSDGEAWLESRFLPEGKHANNSILH